MSVDYKTQKEIDKELFVDEVRSDVKDIIEGYYKGEVSIGWVMNELEKLGLEKRYVASSEAQIVGNNILSDDIIDYVMDRINLEALKDTNDYYAQVLSDSKGQY